MWTTAGQASCRPCRLELGRFLEINICAVFSNTGESKIQKSLAETLQKMQKATRDWTDCGWRRLF